MAEFLFLPEWTEIKWPEHQTKYLFIYLFFKNIQKQQTLKQYSSLFVPHQYKITSESDQHLKLPLKCKSPPKTGLLLVSTAIYQKIHGGNSLGIRVWALHSGVSCSLSHLICPSRSCPPTLSACAGSALALGPAGSCLLSPENSWSLCWGFPHPEINKILNKKTQTHSSQTEDHQGRVKHSQKALQLFLHFIYRKS